ncbi:MAG: trimethylamine methyltransferase family protein [Dehalococcoidales bacterium]|nr:trimethylamine methyltransferase family protein [Dehalococcoidales bacterium]
MARPGVVIEPYQRLKLTQVERIHRASLEILTDPGIICFNRTAAELFADHGAEVTATGREEAPTWQLKIPERLVNEAIGSCPKTVKLGARNQDNCLVLDGAEARVHFASGSEANKWLEVDVETFVSKRDPSRETELAVFREEKGTAGRLAQAARLCERLDSWDSFLRTVNIQDEDINRDNKDVNKFFVALNNTTKHVMSGLTEITKLKSVVRMARIIAGGEDEFQKNPILSFITCVVKSPLQLVDDTTQKAIEIARLGIPLVISSSPQGGSTAPIKEEGMVAQINAEILTGITLTQMVNKGAPVLYGSVPVRTRMDNLYDSYGVPEFSQYNVDCIQMARHYGLPCYSTAGVSDVAIPSIQAAVERLFSHILVTLAGAHYVHYAFGLLERTNVFCPVQAVLDDVHIDMVKRFVRQPEVSEASITDCLTQVRKVMTTSHKLYVRFVRHALRSGGITPPYPFESKGMTDETLVLARQRLEKLLSLPAPHLGQDIIDRIFKEVPGLLPRLRNL